MTPKEKAKQLYNKFIVLTSDETIEKRHRTAKTCALICVKEIQSYPNNEFVVKGSWTDEYWNQVRLEINNL